MIAPQKKLDLDHSYAIQPSEFSPGYSPLRELLRYADLRKPGGVAKYAIDDNDVGVIDGEHHIAIAIL